MGYEEDLEKEFEEFQKNNEMPTVAILGCTGCGKSSLINTVFGENLAEVSHSKPQTQEFRLYPGDKKKEIYVNLMDSKGYELSDGTGEQYLAKLKAAIDDYSKKGIAINVAWYCIAVGKNRIEEIDEVLLKGISEMEGLKDKVMCVITKCDIDDESGSIAKSYKEQLKEKFPKLKAYEISTDKEIDLDLKELIRDTKDILTTDGQKRSFITSQKRYIDLKKEEAEKAITKYVIGAGAVGASPIPFSDAILLVPTQLTMMTHIAGIYGVRNMVNLSKGVILNIIMGNLGRALAGSLAKLIPGVGSIAGGAINATIASSITYGMGKAMSKMCYSSCENILAGKSGEISMKDNKFTEEVSKYIKEYKDKNKK